MTTSEVPTATRHRQAAEQGQGGDDEEAAAGADEPGDQADDRRRRAGPAEQRQLGVLRGRSRGYGARGAWRAAVATIISAKASSSSCPGDVAADEAAGERAGHAGDAEEQPGAPADPPGAGVADDAGRAGDADDEQRGGDRLLGGQPGDVDQERHGQDRAAAAEQAEGDADERRPGRGRARAQGHRSRRRRSGPDDHGVDVAGGAAVVRQLGQRDAHRAGVGERRRRSGRRRWRRRATSAPGRRRCRARWPATRLPATRRTWRSRSQSARPRLTGAPAASQAMMPPSRTRRLGRPASREGLLGLGGAGAGAADQHDVLVEVATQLGAVLAQRVQRHVVGAGDVGGLELGRGAHVEQARGVVPRPDAPAGVCASRVRASVAVLVMRSDLLVRGRASGEGQPGGRRGVVERVVDGDDVVAAGVRAATATTLAR